jgi:hypothetical protein
MTGSRSVLTVLSLTGRWWMDSNGNGQMDSEDHFFSCPLLGPGRTEP